MSLVINTDGASRGNPGPASIGFIIKTDSGVILHQEGKAIGEATNNVAEYTAVFKALEYVKKYLSKKPINGISFFLDSMLVVEQLSGRYKIKNNHLKSIFDQVKSLELELGKITYTHVPREQNFIADRLANKALDDAK